MQGEDDEVVITLSTDSLNQRRIAQTRYKRKTSASNAEDDMLFFLPEIELMQDANFRAMKKRLRLQYPGVSSWKSQQG